MCLVYARHGVYIDMRQVGVEANNCARQCGAWVARQPEGGAMDVNLQKSVTPVNIFIYENPVPRAAGLLLKERVRSAASRVHPGRSTVPEYPRYDFLNLNGIFGK